MRPLGLVDGRLVDLTENVVPMEDRGHQFGDGVYEVTKIYNGQCFALPYHMERLYRSLRELKIPVTYTYEELAGFHAVLLQESGIKEGAVYLQITRGVAPRTHSFPATTVPRLTMSVRPADTANRQMWQDGVKVICLPDERWLRCDIKSLNLLGNILGKQRAKETNCFEGVLVRDGMITEGTSSNFFLVRDGVLWTHPATNLILKGVTRTLLLEKVAPDLGLPVIEKPFTVEFAQGADEAFLSGTTTEVMPVVKIDGKAVNDGTVGPITRQLQAAYKNLIERECF
ncbi:aminotransferases class-iv signature [Lucifera butyrica]|uniref:D-alanine aminotransferase n=1 Tax=Lucifera butyrica TaxID=1351585 RepID=A0A498RBW6_9FIRM|nr:D-amino-acid transaminase [Lucifera butyrica]VBB08739.1 aminotransferases class-iv signature [Lucifera butyrica]